MNQLDRALTHLTQAVESAYAFDHRPDETTIRSLLLGEQTDRKTDFDTADSRPLQVILRDSWLIEIEFDRIRNTPEFKAIMEKLN